MASIHATIAAIKCLDPELARQVQKYVKDHTYGLVFEHNLPEAVRLWKKIPCKGDIVNILPPRRQFDTAENKVPWVVKSINGDLVTLVHENETKDISITDVVVLVSWRDVIYPGLRVMDKVERGNSGDPYHVVINSENYHALEALAYAYAGTLDCIYIDPPYNVGKKDWKYNNDYVDPDDQYKHSKWLAFMERRLKLAKQLLNPNDSVMIVTIDEKEYLRLGMLLEQMFPEARIQMISTCIKPSGTNRVNEFSRAGEYIFFVMFGSACPANISSDWMRENKVETKGKKQEELVTWQGLRRRGGTGDTWRRRYSPGCFYPLFIDEKTNKFLCTGNPISLEEDRHNVVLPEGTYAVWPLDPNGEESRWQITVDRFNKQLSDGTLFVNSVNKEKETASVLYLKSGDLAKIESGLLRVVGRDEKGKVLLESGGIDSKTVRPKTIWVKSSHDASLFGTTINSKLMPDRSFPYPKSVYAVEDCLFLFLRNKPDALIVDFFAGSGTTAHATMLLNHLDGGHRRTVSVTNNEVSADEEKEFTKAGLRPSDPDWEKYGIAKYITWPRIKAAIKGINTEGEPVKGDYKFTEEFSMSEGFTENAVFCELTYESAWPIRLDNAFDAIAPILWMQAGCKGSIIRKIGKCFATTDYYGVLFNYNQASKFCEQVKKKNLKTVYVVTDDQRRYSNMCKRLPGVAVHRLYETYLRTFEIHGEGGLD